MMSRMSAPCRRASCMEPRVRVKTRGPAGSP
jgi:hypothetical protein